MKKMPVEEQAEEIVKRIIGGKYETEVFSQLNTIEDQIEREIYTYEELKRYAPLFCEYNLKEKRRMLSLINKKLLEEIKKEDNSYLKVVRILEALNATKSIERVKKTSSKIKFCLEYYRIAEANGEPTRGLFKIISLLDRA